MLQTFDEPGCDRFFYVFITVLKKPFYELEKLHRLGIVAMCQSVSY